MKASPTREWTLCLPRRGHARLCRAEPASGRIPRLARLMALALRFAPDIQEQILFLPLLRQGRERLHLADLQALCRTWDWRCQRRLWQALLLRTSPHSKNYLERA
jgi:hypothetical protein